jgi:hypothetical protein
MGIGNLYVFVAAVSEAIFALLFLVFLVVVLVARGWTLPLFYNLALLVLAAICLGALKHSASILRKIWKQSDP